ncbi:hypothetical protein [Micromonospora chersina]|uniref:hypothetical protein n=1 Tax=Micromonospora chersina TaxID=47854 RepID=UPI00371EBE93
MSAERDVIDLDDHNHQTVEPASAFSDRLMARRKWTLRLVAAFVLGGVLGGIGVSGLHSSREQREQSSSVSLVALPASAGSGGSDGKGAVRLDGQLAVINTGPAPITVRSVAAERRGVLIRDSGGDAELIRAGGTAWVDVTARIECSVEIGSEPLSMRFTVETRDKQVREFTYPVAVVGSVWHRVAEQPCEHLR